MSDLVSGKYGQLAPLMSLLGGTSNVVNSSIPARSNIEYNVGNLSDGALAGTGVLAAVPVPVDPGTVISKVSIFVGATAASTPTHQFAAIYQGTGAAPKFLAQSTDTTTAAIAASGILTYTLSAPYEVTPTDAPYGFIYAGVAITASTVCTAIAAATPTGINYAWTTNGPLFLAMTAGTALGATAATTIASPSAKAVAPIVVLT